MQILPCKLCLYQRYLWIILFIFSLFNLFTYFRYIKIIIIFNLSLIALLSLYHSGIELGVFNNIISCSPSNDITANNIEDLDYLIRNTENNDCAFPKFFLLNLSLSNISFIFSSILFLLCLKFFNIHIFKLHGKEKN
jgi:disulfide bond formation protein DsbB